MESCHCTWVFMCIWPTSPTPFTVAPHISLKSIFWATWLQWSIQPQWVNQINFSSPTKSYIKQCPNILYKYCHVLWKIKNVSRAGKTLESKQNSLKHKLLYFYHIIISEDCCSSYNYNLSSFHLNTNWNKWCNGDIISYTICWQDK